MNSSVERATHSADPLMQAKPQAIVAWYVIGCLLLDLAAYPHALFPLSQSPWNPPAGLSVAFILLFGLRLWPLLFISATLAKLLLHGLPEALPATGIATLLLAACYALIATFLVRVAGITPSFRQPRDLNWFVVAALPGTLLTALAYVGVPTLLGDAEPDRFLGNLIEFWVNDLIRLLIVAPLVLAWAEARPKYLRPRIEMAAMAASIALALWVIFGLEYTNEFKFFYMLFLPLIWIAMRHGLRGATLALLAIHLGLNGILAWRGHGPITVVEFKLLMLGLALTGLFMGMTVTGRRETEARLMQREAELNQALRLAAAGEMAQTLAHELNQPLTALASYARAAQSMLVDPAKNSATLAETLDKIARESLRAGQAIHHLREFFRSGQLRLASVPVSALLDEALAPARRRAGQASIELQLRISASLPPVRVDRAQVGAVLHNLVSNAIDSLGEASDDWREIEVRAEQGGPGWVRFCVTDNGPGIAEDIAPRLFQPFNSSKPSGMGLGLLISRTLVEAHGGKLWLESIHPARFCFTLPCDDTHS